MELATSWPEAFEMGIFCICMAAVVITIFMRMP